MGHDGGASLNSGGVYTYFSDAAMGFGRARRNTVHKTLFKKDLTKTKSEETAFEQ